MKYEIEKAVYTEGDSRIVEDGFSVEDGTRRRVIRRVLDTGEKQTRDALIALGWTPPDAKR